MTFWHQYDASSLALRILEALLWMAIYADWPNPCHFCDLVRRRPGMRMISFLLGISLHETII